MFLDHFNAFATYQPVDDAASLPDTTFGTRPAPTVRPKTGGLLPSTLVETDTGFIQARHLKVGDVVYTFDGGCQEVQSVKQSVPRLTAMMHVPAGALGNERDMDLPADLVIALDEETAEDLFDVPVVLAKLAALAGYNGIVPALPQRLARIHVTFAEDELIWTEGGMLLHMSAEHSEAGAYWSLSLEEVRALIASSQGRSLPEVSTAFTTAQNLPHWWQQVNSASPTDVAA